MPSAFTLREILSQFSRQKDVISLTQFFLDIGAKLASTANSCLEEEFKRKEMDRVFGQSLLHFLFLIDSSPAVNYENYHK